MAQKSGTVKRFLMTVILLALLVLVFILLGGGNLLRSAGKWISGMGKEAETIKQKVEEKATNTGKTMEKVIDTVKPKPGDKK